MFEFTWEIESVNNELKTFIVKYTKVGDTQGYAYNLNMPPKGTDLKKYIEAHAPNFKWIQPDLEILTPELIGKSGTNKIVHTLESARAAKLKELLEWRYSLEVGGIIFNGYKVDTSRVAQSMITSAYTSLKEGLQSVIDFKITPGVFVKLDLRLATDLAKAVTDHVQNCFTLEKTFTDKINACTTVEEVLAVKFA